MTDKVWETLKPAVAEAVEKFRDGIDGGGVLLADRIQAALRGSDWRYVRSLGGTLKREV